MASDVRPGPSRKETPPGLAGRPLVSVVMIFLDPESEFFAHAVLSVLSQTFQDWELLLCNDGSGVESTAAAEAWADEHPDRVRHLHHLGRANLGMSATRNLGIANARGGYITFLDSDDAWLPEHLDRAVSQMLETPEADAVCGGAVEWLSWREGHGLDHPADLAWPTGTVVAPPVMLEALLLRPETRTPTCSLLVRSDILRGLGGAEVRFRGMFEDQALLAKLFTSSPVVIGAPDTALYRRHDGSTSAAAARDGSYSPSGRSAARDEWLLWLDGYLSGRAESFAVVHGLVRREIAERPPTSALTRSKATGLVRSAKTALRRVEPLPARLSRRLSRSSPGRLATRLRLTATGSQPLSTTFGYDRGTPIDRYYIERFLARSAYLVRGAVLEVGDDSYTRRYGQDAVKSADVLNIHPDAGTTIIGDLEQVGSLPRDRFDCAILTQTLHLLWDLPRAIGQVHDSLRPGGVVLATIPFISQISDDRWASQWLWGISPLAARRLFEDRFGSGRVQVESFGNVRAATAFLEGHAVEEVPHRILDRFDDRYPMLVAVRAWRPAGR